MHKRAVTLIKDRSKENPKTFNPTLVSTIGKRKVTMIDLTEPTYQSSKRVKYADASSNSSIIDLTIESKPSD
jgi:hypothetical protein